MGKQAIGTIRDVAARAGVSVSTVSRVLNNNYPVSTEVRKRVLEITDIIHYKPNSIAKNLRSHKSQMIGLIVADIGNLFFMQIAKGIESVVSESGYNIMIASSDGDVKKERRLLNAMMEERPAALIISSFDTESRYLQEFIDVGIPVVMTDRYLDNFDCDVVVMDDFEIAYRLTTYLINRGHRDIALANVLLSISSGRERYEGYLKALSENGLKLNNQYVSSGNFNALDNKLWIRELFSQKKRPTALICANNIMAAGALMAFKELSFTIPEDVSVISIGSVPFQELIEPKITASTHGGFKMGEYAGQMTLERIKRQNMGGGKKIVIKSELMEHGSVRAI